MLDLLASLTERTPEGDYAFVPLLDLRQLRLSQYTRELVAVVPPRKKAGNSVATLDSFPAVSAPICRDVCQRLHILHVN